MLRKKTATEIQMSCVKKIAENKTSEVAHAARGYKLSHLHAGLSLACCETEPSLSGCLLDIMNETGQKAAAEQKWLQNQNGCATNGCGEKWQKQNCGKDGPRTKNQ